MQTILDYVFDVRPLTPRQQLAGILLGRPLLDWLSEGVESGASCRQLAHNLYRATNGQIDVTGEAVRRWLSDAGLKTARAESRGDAA